LDDLDQEMRALWRRTRRQRGREAMNTARSGAG
jgi:hypothetical protein